MTSKSAILKEASRHTGKHGGVEKRAVAYANTILRIQVGSGLMGISVNGTDDRDEMGVCIEPPLYVIGLREFELYEHHTAWEREGGLRNRSGHGDLDENVYSLRKFTRLALAGNPSIITMFFVPETEIVSVSPFGRELLAQAPDVISREAAARYYGYLHAQRRGLLSHEGKGRDVTRPELIEKYGWDTKFGGHMIRLGMQGKELLETGRLTLPMHEWQRDLIKEIRTGQHSMQDVLDMAERLESQLLELMVTTSLPEHPDRDAVNAWLIDAYQETWGYHDGPPACWEY
jgi:hypothetical protein